MNFGKESVYLQVDPILSRLKFQIYIPKDGVGVFTGLKQQQITANLQWPEAYRNMTGGWESKQWYVHVLYNPTSWLLHRMYVQKMIMVLKVFSGKKKLFSEGVDLAL